MYNETAYLSGQNRSAIRDLFEYGVKRAAEVGIENVFDYSLGNPSLPAPPQVRQALEAVLENPDNLAVHGYTSAVGDLQTRQAIAQDLTCRYGCAVLPEELFLTCGAAPALTAVLGALSVPGGEVVAIAPYFPEYRVFVEHAGLGFRVTVPDIPDFQIPFDSLKETITEKTVALIINSPNNPSGAVYTEKTLKTLAAVLKEKQTEFGHPIYIISDEPYRELVYGNAVVPFLPAIYENTVICYSYSKSLSLPGERIGYVYVPNCAWDGDKLYAAVAGAARRMGHVCAPSIWQKVIARCAHLRPDLDAYDRNRRVLLSGLRQAGYEVVAPDGAFYLFVKAPTGDANIFSEMAKKKDLLVVPGDSFGCPGYFRLCYCVDLDKIQRSLPLFKALIEAI